jgi:hypothetical protein
LQKCEKWDGVVLIFSQVPLGQKSSDLHKSFLNLLKSWSLGSDGATIKKTNLHKIILEKIFSKTGRPMKIKLDANYPCMKGIQVCLDKRADCNQKGDDHKNANIGWGHLKILFL